MGQFTDKVREIIYENTYADPDGAEKALAELFGLNLETTQQETKTQEERDKALAEAVAKAVSDKLTPNEVDPMEAERECLAALYPSISKMLKEREESKEIPGEEDTRSITSAMYPSMRAK